MGGCTTVVWFRRDLRVEDNPALVAAARSGGPVIPVFIWAPEEEGHFVPGRVSRWWLKQSLLHLHQSLSSLGSPLVLRHATNALSVLLNIVQTTGATQVFYNHLYDPVSLVRDHKVKQGLVRAGIGVSTFNADLLYEPWEITSDDETPFTTFAEFWSKCMDMPMQPEASLLPPKRLTKYQGPLFSSSIEDLELENESEKGSNDLLARAWAPGWMNADKAFEVFLNGPLLEYASNRQKVDSVTSLLSPHLHYGELSVRKVFCAVSMKQVLWVQEGNQKGEESVNLFLRSIGFREYSRYLSFNFPFTHERSLLSNLKFFPWRIDEGFFKIWRQGRTGYPLVDAGMRELWATGWLHNCVREVVSCFFVKFLQLPWRWGMKYFWDTLLDADLECDVLGWQYISGSLPDGHELDYIENPQTEGYKYDPDGEYVRRWLPELSRLPSKWIHHPWDAPSNVLRAAGVELGTNYPRPIVEEVAARQRLQQALAIMWEKDAAEKSALQVGLEEGLGETVEIQGDIGAEVKNMDTDVGLHNRNMSDSRSLNDQMVPEMVGESVRRTEGVLSSSEKDTGDLGSFVAPENERPSGHKRPLPQTSVQVHEGVNTDRSRGRHEDVNSASLRGGNEDANSTAESSSARRHHASDYSAWPHYTSSQSVDSQVPLVPELRQGVLSRMRNHHAQPMMNLDAIHATKTSSLSA